MRKRATSALAAGFALAVLGLSGAAEAAEPKIIVVDMRRAVYETEDGLRVQATLKRLFDSRQQDLAIRQQQLQSGQQVINQKLQAGTPQQKLAAEIRTLEQQYIEFQTLTQEYQREMQGREQQLTSTIWVRVSALVRKIAAQENADFIVDKQAVAYMRADLDVTDRAIQMFNSGQVGDATPAPPAKTPPAKPAPAPAPKK